MDVVSISAQRHTALVLPSLSHAIALWPKYRRLVRSRHADVLATKTILHLKDTGTRLALWMPYAREPTQPLDFSQRGYYLVSPYGKEVF